MTQRPTSIGLIALACLSVTCIASCGGGGGSGDSPSNLTSLGTTVVDQKGASNQTSSGSTTTPTTTTTTTTPTTTTTTTTGSTGGTTGSGSTSTTTTTTTTPPVVKVTPFSCDASALTCAEVLSTGTAAQAKVPVTFGQAFKSRDLTDPNVLTAKDSRGNNLPLQVDGISTRPDGSIRYAILSTVVPNLGAGDRTIVNLYKSTAATRATGSPDASAYSLDINLKVHQPQVTLVKFSNRTPSAAGTAFELGKTVSLTLTSTRGTRTYSQVIDSSTSTGTYLPLSYIADRFQKAIAKDTTSPFKAIREGVEGGYETVWLMNKNPEDGPFTVSYSYDGAAPITITERMAYAPPSDYVAQAGSVVRAAVQAGTNMHLKGALANEYNVSVPFTSTDGRSTHPHLSARLHVRLLEDGRARTDMVIENTTLFVANPTQYQYTLTAKQNGTTVYTQGPLRHTRHARWHQVIWQGSEPQARVRQYMPYMLASGMLYNYNYNLQIPESTLVNEANALAAADTSPFGLGLLTAYFPTTGGRADIGPYPRWTALYLITQDDRAWRSMMANANAAGGVPVHYRDPNTKLPVDIGTYPTLALRIGTSVPALPTFATDWAALNPWTPDIAHQSNFAFVPYVITGDAYYLEELQFWASWNMAANNPGYREGTKGLMAPEQVRGQAWGLRSIGDAARATPDNHPMKTFFTDRLNHNITYYQTKFSDSSTSSPMGIIEKPDQVGVAGPWQNDFMGIVMAQLLEDGYTGLSAPFAWISRFNVGRFLHEKDEGFCLAKAPAYYIYIKANKGAGAFFNSWKDIYQENWGTVPTPAECAAMPLDSSGVSATGYGGYARAMLGAAYNAGYTNALTGYTDWVAKSPTIDQGYLADPTWAIIPRAR